MEVVEGPRIRVYVAAAPEGGKANDAVVSLLAKSLGVSKSSITILQGHRGRDKLLSVDGVGAAEVYSRLSGR